MVVRPARPDRLQHLIDRGVAPMLVIDINRSQQIDVPVTKKLTHKSSVSARKASRGGIARTPSPAKPERRFRQICPFVGGSRFKRCREYSACVHATNVAQYKCSAASPRRKKDRQC